MDKIYQIIDMFNWICSINHNIFLLGYIVTVDNKVLGNLRVNYINEELFLNLIYDKYKSKIIYYLILKIILHVHEAR